MTTWTHRFTPVSRRLAAGLLACGLGLLALGAHASDDPPGRVGRLAEMRGQVWLLEGGQGEWQTASRNRPVTTADRVATDRDSRAELQIGSTTVRLGDASDLEVSRLDDDRIELTLHSGSAALRVREPEVAREVQLTTPEGRFRPRGPGLYRVDRGERGSFGSAASGELDFESRDSQLTMRAGQRAELWLDAGDQRTHYNWTTAANDEFEQWVRQDEARDDQRYAQRRPISPEMTGADDLEGSGQWGQHPDYGAIWYPTVVAADWAPYRYGRWAWVRPWGWTWVDDAAWGFAPFHYGRWVHFGGRWCWAPGTYVRRPIYAPAMVGWIGGPHLSLSVSIGGPPVGWVPLAPREPYYPQYRVSPVYIQQVNITHVHLPPRPAPDPGRPVMYSNRGVPGGVTVVSSDVLTKRQAVNTAPRASDDVVMRAVRDQRSLASVAPPTPANASLAPRVVQTQAAVAAQPRPPTDRNRAALQNGDDGRGARPGAERRGEPPAVAGPVTQAPPVGRPSAEPATPRPQVTAPSRDSEPREAREPRVPRGDPNASPANNGGVQVAPAGNGESYRVPAQRPPATTAPAAPREVPQAMPVPRREPRERERDREPQVMPQRAAPIAPQPAPQPAPQQLQREERVERQAPREERNDKPDRKRERESRRDNPRDNPREFRREGPNGQS
jgi:hypothetical protein